MRVFVSTLAAAAAAATAAYAQLAQPLRPDQVEFRGIYKELVETNTTLSAGSCTEAAHKMGARLAAAGYAPSDITYFEGPGHPKEGGMVAVLKGSDPKAGAVLLLGHIDVVEAHRADWTRDPFTLIEENGYFYGRGTSDMKSIDAIWVDTMIRLKKAPKPPKRTLKLALTCGEESDGAFNGADWLAKNKPDLVRADFGLNEGAGGRLDAMGNRQQLSVQVGQKAYQDYRLTVMNPGGHSSRPRPDNAIYQLADALEKVRGYDFPPKLSETTRLQLGPRAAQGDKVAAALKAFLANPADLAAAKVADTDPSVNAILHTNCVATLLSAGHAPNALPQRATANINCRILPDESVDQTLATLTTVLADPALKIEPAGDRSPVSPPPPLTPQILGPAETVAAQLWPGVPLVPAMTTGATDGRFMLAAGVPTYGLTGMFGDPDGGGVHGLNERIRVRSLYEGREFLYRVTKLYAAAK